jgi:hypothetical protein
MLDAKFVCTISALVAALVAVCSFNSNRKMEIIEGYGNPNSRGFGAWQGASQFSVYKDPAQVITKVNGQDVVTPNDLKSGMFYSTVGLQQQLAPRATATSIYGALKNQSQAQTQQAANGPHGAIPEGSTNPAFLTSGASPNVSTINTGVPTLVQSSSELTSSESETATKAAGVTGEGNIMYSMGQTSENYQPSIENFIVPGDKKPRCSTQNCPTGPEFMADPVMKANYTNGNFETMSESLLEAETVQDIPIGTMKTLNANGDETNVLQLNRLIYANTKSRSRGEACLLRGDIVPQTVLSRNQGGMFCTAQSYRGVEPLGLGALAAMGGPNVQSSTLGDQITASVSSRASTAVAGSTYNPQYLSQLLGDESTLAIETGLRPNATLQQQAGAATALAVGGSSYTVANGAAA